MKYTLELEIDKPRAEVVEKFEDVDSLGAWQPDFLGAEPISGEPGTAGSKLMLKYEHGKRDLEMEETVEVANLPDEFSGTFVADGMKMTVRNYFTEVGTEKTKWVSENEATVSGIVMRIISLIMPGCFKKQSLLYMTNFKGWLEEGRDLREVGS